MNLDHVYAVILAGGGGTRLWPKSRTKTPKQFLRLTGRNTMIQYAAQRMSKIVPWSRIIVVTNSLYFDEVKKLLPEVPTENIVAEPEKRDTALAMLVGALFAKSFDPDAIVINGASDHIITNDAEYVTVMKSAIQVASGNQYLVTVGITPSYATSAFGYIKIGTDLQKLEHGLSLFKVDSFTEKPHISTARAFIATGRYFWNANMYVWSAAALQEAFKKHLPVLYEATLHLTTLSPAEFQAALPKIYAQAETISIDYAISEKANNLVLIPGDFGWNDVGDWKVVYDLAKKDEHNNALVSEKHELKTVLINSTGNLVYANGKLVALVGVENYTIIDTPEILMICPISRTQDVKKVVELLKSEEKSEYL